MNYFGDILVRFYRWFISFFEPIAGSDPQSAGLWAWCKGIILDLLNLCDDPEMEGATRRERWAALKALLRRKRGGPNA